MGPRAALHIMEKIKISCPCWESTPIPHPPSLYAPRYYITGGSEIYDTVIPQNTH
ncbi:hypothetical protein B7P43_G14412 [Cryptotermes secundus]|uniref:Uncharacterized protein n=1 Tax=Cryptotermes secundus TaxID=105785 RepID=A0A2J7RKM0_9NEOP|nr:hypothetical protein B7P43_G14412 [Cryptotermes secundus]